MISSDFNEWQYIEENGLIYPWYTLLFLQELKGWNLNNLDIFEFGSGYSTLWFSRKCKNIISVDNNKDWYLRVRKLIDDGKCQNVSLYFEENESFYTGSLSKEKREFDIIIIDGAFRLSCAIESLKYVKLGGKIILDNANYDQCKAILSLLRHNIHFSYPQPGHPDWLTDYWIIQTRESGVEVKNEDYETAGRFQREKRQRGEISYVL